MPKLQAYLDSLSPRRRFFVNTALYLGMVSFLWSGAYIALTIGSH